MQEIGDATTNEQQIFYGPSNGLEWVRGDLATGFIEGCFIHYSSWVPYYPSVDLMAIPCVFRKGSNRNAEFFIKNESRLEQLMDTARPIVRFSCRRSQGGLGGMDVTEYEGLDSGSDSG